MQYSAAVQLDMLNVCVAFALSVGDVIVQYVIMMFACMVSEQFGLGKIFVFPHQRSTTNICDCADKCQRNTAQNSPVLCCFCALLPSDARNTLEVVLFFLLFMKCCYHCCSMICKLGNDLHTRVRICISIIERAYNIHAISVYVHAKDFVFNLSNTF